MKRLKFLLLLSTFVLNISAQDKIFPLDPNVRFGKLQNGLTYYIRHNENPAERAEFWIVNRVGSVLEEENEHGLAHFLEHMAFNGTTHFPNNSIPNYMATIGVRINAHTSRDRTTYEIPNVPTVREGIVDSCLLVLHDWSSQIALTDDKIEKERKIIREEQRRGYDATRRMYEKRASIALAGSRYANSSPLGTVEVIENFKPDDLRNFYRRWHRPDLQAIIVVGDIDVNKIESKIKTLFGNIPAPSPDAPKRIYFPVPDNKEPIIAVVTDPEADTRTVLISFKHDPVPDSLKNTEDAWRTAYLRQMASSMMNARLSELAKKTPMLFSKASAGFGSYYGAKTKDTWRLSATSRSGLDIAIETLLEEMERVLRFGFTPVEYERAKAKYISGIEQYYNERNNIKNNTFVNEYIAHFTDNESSVDEKFGFELKRRIADNQTVEQVNDYLKNFISDENRVVMMSGPENRKYPSETEVFNAMALVKNAELTPYEETLSDEPLVSNLPKKGKIESINENAIFGTKELLLSNGVRVSLKKTDFRKDEIRFSAIAEGGLSLIDVKDLPSGRLMNDVLPLGGLGNFNPTDLSKKLAGERASVTFTANRYDQRFSGNSTVKDVETLLQLLYLNFTAPRQNSAAYQDFLKRKENIIKNSLRSKNPADAFNDSINKARYVDNPYSNPYTLADLEKADYNCIIQLYKEKFVSDASSYHFTFVGNFDEDILLPLIEQYIASLPATNAKTTWRDVGVKTRAGEHHFVFEKKMEVPKATVYSLWSGDVPYTLRNIVLQSAVMDIMRFVYREKIREEQGGTYGVSVDGGLSKIPKENFTFSFRFDTDAPLVEPLLAIADEELQRLQIEGPSEENWQKVKQSMLKKREENLKENAFWLNSVQQYYHANIDLETDYLNIVNSITTSEIRDYARRLFSQGNNIKVIQLPE